MRYRFLPAVASLPRRIVAADMPLPSQEDLRRRLRAARALGGFKNTQALAEALGNIRGLGERNLRKLESGEEEIRSPALREIAVACGLPYEFFTVDFAQLAAGGARSDTNAALAERLDQLERGLSGRLEVVEEDLSAVLQMAAAWPTAAPPGVQPTEPPASRSSETNRRPSPRQEGQASEPGTEQ